MSADARLARDRRAIALNRASERRRKQNDALRAQLVAQRAALAQREADLAVAHEQVERDLAAVQSINDQLDAMTTGAAPFVLDDFSACRSVLGIASERLHASEAQLEAARQAVDDAAAAIAGTNRTIARNLGSVDACQQRIAAMRRGYQRAEDDAADDEAEDGVLARRARDRAAA
ncbi:type III secretion protein [Burkholderia glumae]|uniref:Type III secretion protein n=1 Tax=Burkholderia glumae TaxID=337 RepID=A0AAQ0BT74_BURGL|nr:type III secretion protein [Burkholderia glumae]AJY63539.1 bacterial type III secretion family protein [Burkholderia glumae LMG 2196 = ATCC 33617]PNL04942.1 type III secretion protein [Burkholderia glumae]QPQ90832.1 type III secretion protein [Burkholderia glumae]QQM94662.1 type III secretion protein [Burkholderia glumae]